MFCYEIILLFAVVLSCIAQNVISQYFVRHRTDILYGEYNYVTVVEKLVKCGKVCSDNNCAIFAYHKIHQECYLYNSWSCNSTTAIGMEIYMAVDVVDKMSKNVALCKPTEMSSLLRPPYYSYKGVDGILTNDDTNFFHTLGGYTEWWCVDLEKTYNFREVIVYNRYSINYNKVRLIGFELRLSTSGQCDETTFISSSPCFKDSQEQAQFVYTITECNQIPSIQFSSRFIFISPKHNRFLHLREVVVTV